MLGTKKIERCNFGQAQGASWNHWFRLLGAGAEGGTNKGLLISISEEHTNICIRWAGDILRLKKKLYRYNNEINIQACTHVCACVCIIVEIHESAKGWP